MVNKSEFQAKKGRIINFRIRDGFINPFVGDSPVSTITLCIPERNLFYFFQSYRWYSMSRTSPSTSLSSSFSYQFHEMEYRSNDFWELLNSSFHAFQCRIYFCKYKPTFGISISIVSIKQRRLNLNPLFETRFRHQRICIFRNN